MQYSSSKIQLGFKHNGLAEKKKILMPLLPESNGSNDFSQSSPHIPVMHEEALKTG